MRRVLLLFSAVMAAVCAFYTILYLVRWEWNRALIAGVFFLAIEILTVAGLLFDRLRRIETRLDRLADASGSTVNPAPDAETVETLRRTQPDLPDRFGWLRDQTTSTNVFLPVLLGAGVVASALAWCVEQLARVTLSPTLERRLALRLGTLAAPSGGLLGTPERRPAASWQSESRRASLRSTLVAMGLLAAIAATAAGIDFVADRTQTRPFERVEGVTTTVDLELLGKTSAMNPERMMGHLWSICTAPNVFPGRSIPPADITHLDDANRVRVTIDADIGANYTTRLRGCLEDATLDRIQARVIGITAT